VLAVQTCCGAGAAVPKALREICARVRVEGARNMRTAVDEFEHAGGFLG
jgi:hypothetical protein